VSIFYNWYGLATTRQNIHFPTKKYLDFAFSDKKSLLRAHSKTKDYRTIMKIVLLDVLSASRNYLVIGGIQFVSGGWKSRARPNFRPLTGGTNSTWAGLCDRGANPAIRVSSGYPLIKSGLGV